MRRNMQTTKGQPGHILVKEVTRYITVLYKLKQIRVKRNYVFIYNEKTIRVNATLTCTKFIYKVVSKFFETGADIYTAVLVARSTCRW